MNTLSTELSARYYNAETTTWIIAAVLIIYSILGIDASQPLPVIGVILKNNQYFPHVLTVITIAAVMYLIFEWKQSSQESRNYFINQIRAVATVLIACTGIWFIYPFIAVNTPYTGTSPIWFFGFLGLGFLIGGIASMLVLATLMIRTPEEAKTICLSRVPAATQAQYIGGIPAIVLLLLVYYALNYFSPLPIARIAFILTGFICVIFLVELMISLFFYRDKSGKRIPYKERVARIKKVYDVHDYTYFLFPRIEKIRKRGYNFISSFSPKKHQDAIRKKCSINNKKPFICHTQNLEKMGFKYFFKDGNSENTSPENCGVKIYKSDGGQDTLRVLVIPDESELGQREILIPIRLIEKYMEEYIVLHKNEAEIPTRKLLSYAVNNSAIETMLKEIEVPLILATEHGDEKLVADLLKKNVDVNKQGESGYTALLMAAAQGYPRIMKLLLDAGANPDMGNLLGITPLIFGAYYGNIDVCKILIEYGAKSDLQDYKGKTALMVAVQDGHLHIVKMLLQAGANIQIQNERSHTALDIAHMCKQGKIAKMLRLADKKRN